MNRWWLVDKRLSNWKYSIGVLWAFSFIFHFINIKQQNVFRLSGICRLVCDWFILLIWQFQFHDCAPRWLLWIAWLHHYPIWILREPYSWKITMVQERNERENRALNRIKMIAHAEICGSFWTSAEVCRRRKVANFYVMIINGYESMRRTYLYLSFFMQRQYTKISFFFSTRNG